MKTSGPDTSPWPVGTPLAPFVMRAEMMVAMVIPSSAPMGLKQGAYCTGCWWFLMALLFVAGVMNVWWIAIIALFVLLEKVVPQGLFVGKVAGVLLVAWGVWMALR